MGQSNQNLYGLELYLLAKQLTGGQTELFLIDTPYRIYLKKHDQELADVNEILQDKQGDVWILQDGIRERNGQQLSSMEKQRLLQEREKLGVYMILKSDSTIY